MGVGGPAPSSDATTAYIHTTQSWGEHGYGRIQRGKIGASEGDDRLYECGLGCISYYTFLPVGGVRCIFIRTHTHVWLMYTRTDDAASSFLSFHVRSPM